VKHLPPKAAYEFLRQHPEALFVDCRSETEYYFVGHALGSMHIAWSDGPDWALNIDFVQHVRARASLATPVVLICRSGNRSYDAGMALERAGFCAVYDVEHGFEGELDACNHRGTRSGWRHDGLPWEQT
jgi:rhodanese-related sulfurtransferase